MNSEILKFEKGKATQPVADQIMIEFSDIGLEHQALLRRALEQVNCPDDIFKLQPLKPWAVNRYRDLNGEPALPYITQNQKEAIHVLYNAYEQRKKDDIERDYIKEKKAREAVCGKVVKSLLEKRIGSSIEKELTLDRTLMVKATDTSDIVALVKKIQELTKTGSAFAASDALEELKKMTRKEGESVATFLARWYAQLEEWVRCGATDLENPLSNNYQEQKKALILALKVNKSDTIMVSVITEIMRNKEMTYTQMQEKLVEGEQMKAQMARAVGDKAPTEEKKNKKAANLATKSESKKEEKYKKKGDETKTENDQGKYLGYGQGRGRGPGRGNRGGRGGRGGRGKFDPSLQDRGHLDQPWRGENRDESSRGRGRGRGSWRGRGEVGHGGHRVNWQDGHSNRFMMVCKDCKRVEDICQCGGEHEDVEQKDSGKRKANMAQIGYDDYSYDFDEDPYEDPNKRFRVFRSVKPVACGVHGVPGNEFVQFDPGANVSTLRHEHQPDMHVHSVTTENVPELTGIHGPAMTPQKQAKVGQLQFLVDNRFHAEIASGPELLKVNPGSGTILTSDGMLIVSGEGMRRIDEALQREEVLAQGIKCGDGWYLAKADVEKLSHGTPVKTAESPRTVHSALNTALRPRLARLPSGRTVIIPPVHHRALSARQRQGQVRRSGNRMVSATDNRVILTPEKIRLAAEAQRVREMFHPSDRQLANMLDSGMMNTPALGVDGRNAREIYGPDYPRDAARITRSALKSPSEHHPATRPGERVHGDLHHLFRKNYLSTTDHFSGMMHLTSIGETKSKRDVEKAINRVTGEYNANKHPLDILEFDSEQVLKSLQNPRTRGTQITHKPPGMHERFEERHWQEVQAMYRALLGALSYTVDPNIHPWFHEEVLRTAVELLNQIPNSRTGDTQNAQQIFTNSKSSRLKPTDLLPTGTIVMVRDWNIKDGLDMRRVRTGIVVRPNWKQPGWHYVYDPASKRPIEIEHIRDQDIVDEKAANRAIRQWDGFSLRPTLNRSIQRLPTGGLDDDDDGLEAPPAVPEARPESDEHFDLLGDQPVVGPPAFLPVQRAEGAADAGVHAGPAAQPAAQEGAAQEGAVQDGGGTAQEGAQEVGAAPQATPPRAGLPAAAPQAPQAPVAQPPLSDASPAAKLNIADALQQEGERRGFFSKQAVNSAADIVELTYVIDRIEQLVTTDTRQAYAAKKGGANSGTALRRKYEQENPGALERAVHDEIASLCEKSLGFAIPKESLTVKELYELVHTMLLLKEKFLPSGEFEKLKARLVALGNRMKEGTYGDTYSPTLSHATTMMLLCIGAEDNAEMEITDVPSAFVHTPRPKGSKPVRVVLKDIAAQEWVKARPQDAQYMTKEGHIIVELTNFLYGMKDAPAAFFGHLKQVLEDAGFTAIVSDMCLIKKFSDKGYFLSGGHVDDLLKVYTDDDLKRDFEDALAKAFGNGEWLPTKKLNKEGNYVGMFIQRDRDDRAIYLSQPKHIQKIHDTYPDVEWGRKVTTPSTDELFKYDREAGVMENGEKVDPRKYLGKVMDAMYVAIKTRPDYLKELGFLSGIKEPTERALDMVHRVLIDLWHTRHKRLRLRPRGKKLSAYVDAGFATHMDGYSHSGMVFLYGDTPFFFKSVKQKRVTMSSTDAEYEALTEAAKYIEWMRGLLEEVEIYHYTPIEVYQDNKSTIMLATGPGTFKRSKQNLVRYAYIKELIDKGVIELVWVPTDKMLADILTKVLTGAQFRSQREGLGVMYVHRK